MWPTSTRRLGASVRCGVLAEANHARSIDACHGAGVTVGAFDAEILAWLANYEPKTCAVISGLITRSNASGLTVTCKRTGWGKCIAAMVALHRHAHRLDAATSAHLRHRWAVGQFGVLQGAYLRTSRGNLES